MSRAQRGRRIETVTRYSTRTAFDRRPNRLTRALAERRARGEPIIDLTVSNPTRAGLPYDGEAIRRALADPRALQYTPAPFGLPEARAAVAAEIDVDPRRVVLTASSSEAYGWLFKLLCDPGDAILAPRPSYPLFDQLATFEGVTLDDYDLAYDGAWHLDAAQLRVGPRTRGLLVVSPNNPTGQRLKRDELEALEALGLPIIADEVFAAYPLHPAPGAVSALAATRVPTFVLGGLSKLAGLPQLKAGWITLAGPDDAVDEALARLELIADTWLSVGAPVQHALPALLAAARPTTAAIAARVRDNLAVLEAEARGSSATVLRAEGGWYAIVAVPRIVDDEQWALWLLERDGVRVQPGFFYDFARDGHLVLSLLTPPAPFADGVARLVDRVAAACT